MTEIPFILGRKNSKITTDDRVQNDVAKKRRLVPRKMRMMEEQRIFFQYSIILYFFLDFFCVSNDIFRILLEFSDFGALIKIRNYRILKYEFFFRKLKRFCEYIIFPISLYFLIFFSFLFFFFSISNIIFLDYFT